MKYKIDAIETKQSKTGSKYAKTTVTDEKGAQLVDVAIFGSFPMFESLVQGMEIEAVMKEGAPFNGKPSLSLNPPETAKPTRSGGNAAITKAMDRKEEGIERTMDRKEEGIKMSNSQRDAVLLVTTFYPELAQLEGDIKKVEIAKAIKGWRKWFMASFGDPSDPMNKEPFKSSPAPAPKVDDDYPINDLGDIPF